MWGTTFEDPLSVIFTIACGKYPLVEENIQIQNDNLHWNILFT
jgi:hypothetical protein